MKKNNILLIQPPYPNLAFETTNVPLGLAWLSAVLKKKGFKTSAYDLQVEGTDFKKMGKYIEDIQPEIIGVQFHGQVSFNYSMNALKYIKKTFPGTPVIVGGQQATFRPGPILKEGGADYVVSGEGELILPELAGYILGHPGASKPDSLPSLMYRKNGKIVATERGGRIDDLDSLPLPDRDVFQWRKYPQWVILTSRGCPYECAFCSSSSFWGKTVRFRSAENVVAEMEQLVKKYGVTSFLILDDTFTLKKNRVSQIADLIVEKKLPVKWGCGTRMDQIDESTLKDLKRAGCVEISFGLETANQATLDRIRKEIKVKQQKHAIKIAKAAGFQTRVSTMLGLPGETEKEIRNTLDFLLEAQPNEIQIYPILPFDGTAFSSETEDMGVSVCDGNYDNWVKDSFKPIAESRWLSRDNIVKMAKEMVACLSENGYTHMTGQEELTKKRLDKVVSTGLTAFQLVESYKAKR